MLIAPAKVAACSFSNEAVFSWQDRADSPLSAFAAGHLGVVRPTFKGSYLSVAYRYLIDRPLTESEQQSAVSLWRDKLNNIDLTFDDDWKKVWLDARKLVPDATALTEFSIYKNVSDGEYFQFCNCGPDSFRNAAKTLKSLITKYGASSSQVKEWLLAQDKVFINCSGKRIPNEWTKTTEDIPSPLSDSGDHVLQQYRSYQIAAANFYAMHFDKAGSMFETIAQDASSPYALIAPYLAVRCMIRKATVSNAKIDMPLLKSAYQKVKAMLDDPKFSSLQDSLQDLIGFLSIKIEPEQRLDQLALGIESGKDSHFKQDLCDLSTIEDSDDNAKSDALNAQSKVALLHWLSQYTDKKQHEALKEWHTNHSTVWLLAAIQQAHGRDAGAAELIKSAELLPATSRAYVTANYGAARLMSERGENEKARALLDKLIAIKDLSLSSVNALRQLRASTASNLKQLRVDFALTPVAHGADNTVPAYFDKLEEGKAADQKLEQAFTPNSISLLNGSLPLSVLLNFCADGTLPTTLRKSIVQGTWVRAIICDNAVIATKTAPYYKQLFPKVSALVDKWMATSDPAEKRFAAAYLMLKNFDSSPDIYDSPSPYWWSESAKATDQASASLASPDQNEGDDFDSIRPVQVKWLTASQQSEVASERTKMIKRKAAPDYLPAIAIAFAKSHPADPRVPEALHYCVSCSHYGSSSSSTYKAYSKQAFQILHKSYPNNPWTKKTPYYY